MATHSSIIAWKILWTEESGEPQFIGLQRVRHDCGNLACKMEKATAPHSSTLAWKIPCAEKPGGSMGLQRIKHKEETNTHHNKNKKKLMYFI